MGNIATVVVTGGHSFAAPLISTSSAMPVMERDLSGIVVRTVRMARAAGRDYMAQSHAAATAVMAVRPDYSFGQALDAVERLR